MNEGVGTALGAATSRDTRRDATTGWDGTVAVAEPGAADLRRARTLPVEPDRYRSAVCHEVLVRSSAGPDRDGSGDVVGRTDELDHLVRLGVDDPAAGVLAPVREHTGEAGTTDAVLRVNNTSRFLQPVEPDLISWQGRVPTEPAGGVPSPPVGGLPYLLTLPGHGSDRSAADPDQDR